MNLTTIGQQPVSVSSREIADLCEKRHDNVIRDIKKMLDDLGLPALRFEFTSTVQQPNGGEREVTCFDLPQDLTLTLVSGYSVVLRKRIIDRWIELEKAASTHPDFSNLAIAARAWADQVERNEAQAAKIEPMGDDVAAYERLAGADGEFRLTDAPGFCPNSLSTCETEWPHAAGLTGMAAPT